ncbi:MAG: glycoside hydrolase family 125 protein [Bacteroidetes bacterium]|nr:glycoside hydrolase family 125 protein [Bacteroidota bacterium]
MVSAGSNDGFKSMRPPVSKRKFVSEAVEGEIRKVKSGIADPELAWIFENCYPNTLDTTVEFRIADGKPDTFVITGDIHAMWLRDSSSQVWPYLPLAKEDPKLKALIAGVINRQVKCVLLDPYAEAFNFGPTGSPWDKDHTQMKPGIWERKWELDSLSFPLRLSYGYWKATGDASCFDADWQKAMKLAVSTFKVQQRKNGRGPYRFQRVTATQSDTVPLGGYGNPIKPVGMIVSIFRPSDDATIFPFLVPSNLFAVTSLRQLSEMFDNVVGDKEFAGECASLADEVYEAIQRYAVVNHLTFGQMYPYEVDGFGDRLFMDDASAPSLLSLPYYGCVPVDDQTYLNTRAFVLSENDPYFFKGAAGEGIGSEHVGLNKIWPLSVIMQALTSRDDDEIRRCLDTLIRSTAGTGFMHESFHENDPAKFTRSWFAWANTLFGELVIKIHKEKPYLLS